ncbi:MAG TPA: hypothetical protein PL093_01015 [Candidatus Pacearchaeota archaeon]|nr:hypothetical protein [Candidatus Pacearchaeota archaeon]HRR94758.1 hypothetical protein [Candidatus Paceibacterota bacterium]HPC30537.1 hypothetical protein [Candidatus Pacearchaeota archaeon]HQG09208.1 hypothetical protein [Candidatus Pacearchaeota archaeon]HQH20141.1 hypothetical protein [Candidatus Pacearchaeota archaeon]
MKKTKIFISILALSAILLAYNVFAANENNQSGSAKTDETAVLMQKQKTKAVSEIVRRLAFLNQSIEKIQAMQKISSEQKDIFKTEVQSEIDFLNQLKDKINADTDKTVLFNDRKTLKDRYNIFAFLQSQIAVVSYADKILNIVDLMDAQTTDAMVKSKIASAQNKAQNAINSVVALKLENYPKNKNILQENKQLLVEARKELIEARATMKTSK